jgi:hypothetical protein
MIHGVARGREQRVHVVVSQVRATVGRASYCLRQPHRSAVVNADFLAGTRLLPRRSSLTDKSG